MRNDANLAKHLERLEEARVKRIVGGDVPTVGDVLLAQISGKSGQDAKQILTVWARSPKTGALNIELRRNVAREWLGDA